MIPISRSAMTNLIIEIGNMQAEKLDQILQAHGHTDNQLVDVNDIHYRDCDGGLGVVVSFIYENDEGDNEGVVYLTYSLTGQVTSVDF